MRTQDTPYLKHNPRFASNLTVIDVMVKLNTRKKTEIDDDRYYIIGLLIGALIDILSMNDLLGGIERFNNTCLIAKEQGIELDYESFDLVWARPQLEKIGVYI